MCLDVKECIPRQIDISFGMINSIRQNIYEQNSFPLEQIPNIEKNNGEQSLKSLELEPKPPKQHQVARAWKFAGKWSEIS